jgi:hypothetical protein
LTFATVKITTMKLNYASGVYLYEIAKKACAALEEWPLRACKRPSIGQTNGRELRKKYCMRLFDAAQQKGRPSPG